MKKIVGTIDCHRCGKTNNFYGKPRFAVYCVCGCGLEKDNYVSIARLLWWGEE